MRCSRLAIPLIAALVQLSPASTAATTDDGEYEKRCAEPMDAGPCNYHQPKWYWDTSNAECRQFAYGGCLGNANRFNTREACQKQCLYKLYDQKWMPPLCLLDPDPGYCPPYDANRVDDDRPDGHTGDTAQAQWWYHFNVERGVCEEFLYYGCGTGNGNRFYSLYQCRQVCGERLEPQFNGCDRCDIRTSYCRFYSKLNTSCECRAGYTKEGRGTDSCVDVDECADPRRHQVDCGTNAVCNNTAGGYTCQCPGGFTGDPRVKCTEVGPTSAAESCSRCSPNAKCDVPPSQPRGTGGGRNVSCECMLGFFGDGLNCTDVDECESNNGDPCNPTAECENLPGTFRCQCPKGWAGDGFTCTRAKDACLARTDPTELQAKCHVPKGEGAVAWRQHYYFDHSTRECALLWYGDARCRGQPQGGVGTVRSSSRPILNLFSDMNTCEAMCERSGVLTRSERCRDQFDEHLRQQCDGGSGQWQQRFYYDTSNNGGGEPECRMFWWDGCRSASGSRNFFVDRLECQWLCAEKTRYKSKYCVEPFDPRYRESCQGGRWQKRYYFDKELKRCTPFWFDGCISTGQNFFADELSCVDSCEEMPSAPSNHNARPVASSPQWSAPQIHTGGHSPQHIPGPTKTQSGSAMKSSENPHKKTNHGSHKSSASGAIGTNVCDREDPCRNNGTCVVSSSHGTGYYCECAPGFTNDNCTELVDFDPCANAPCLNAGTCSAKASKAKATFECQCPRGYAGERCELKPCEPAPCKNNGTCRTTKAGPPWYFCECPPQWGGKNCVIEIPAGDKPKSYSGSSAEQLSSGKVEWINEIKEQLNNSSVETDNSSLTTGDDDNALHPARNNDGGGGEEKPRASIEGRGTGAGGPNRRAGKKTKPGQASSIVGEESPTRTLSDKSSKGTSEEANGSEGRVNAWRLAVLGHIIVSIITTLHATHAFHL